MDDIHIGIAFDQHYADQFYALLASMASSNKGEKLFIHAIVTDLPEATKANIEAIVASEQFKIQFYAINKQDLEKYILTGKWTLAVYYRLFFPIYLKGIVERIIYLDTDILVVNRLGALFQTDMEHFPVAAVYDNYVQKQTQIGVDKEGEYFNSGMMLIDLPMWNGQKISERCFDYLSKYPERIKFVDQCALNAVLKDNWLKLPYTYNCLTSYIPRDLNQSQKNGFLTDIVIFHFTLERPWIYLNKHPFRKLYYQYLKQYSVSKYKFISDFEISKIPQRLKLNFIEWYLGNAMMRGCWNKIKTVFKIPE